MTSSQLPIPAWPMTRHVCVNESGNDSTCRSIHAAATWAVRQAGFQPWRQPWISQMDITHSIIILAPTPHQLASYRIFGFLVNQLGYELPLPLMILI